MTYVCGKCKFFKNHPLKLTICQATKVTKEPSSQNCYWGENLSSYTIDSFHFVTPPHITYLESHLGDPPYSTEQYRGSQDPGLKRYRDLFRAPNCFKSVLPLHSKQSDMSVFKKKERKKNCFQKPQNGLCFEALGKIDFGN